MRMSEREFIERMGFEPRQSYEKDAWNAAIDAAIDKLNTEFVAPEVVINIIQKLKI